MSDDFEGISEKQDRPFREWVYTVEEALLRTAIAAGLVVIAVVRWVFVTLVAKLGPAAFLLGIKARRFLGWNGDGKRRDGEDR